jgi:hypothetical protein
MILCNGVVIVSPCDFGIRHIDITKYRKSISTIFSSLKWHNVNINAMKTYSAILDLLHAYRRTSPEMSVIKPDCVIKDDNVITHEQKNMGNGLLIVPPHKFEHRYVLLRSIIWTLSIVLMFLWSQIRRVMDKVQIIDRSVTAPSSKTFRDESSICIPEVMSMRRGSWVMMSS